MFENKKQVKPTPAPLPVVEATPDRSVLATPEDCGVLFKKCNDKALQDRKRCRINCYRKNENWRNVSLAWTYASRSSTGTRRTAPRIASTAKP